MIKKGRKGEGQFFDSLKRRSLPEGGEMANSSHQKIKSAKIARGWGM